MTLVASIPNYGVLPVVEIYEYESLDNEPGALVRYGESDDEYVIAWSPLNWLFVLEN